MNVMNPTVISLMVFLAVSGIVGILAFMLKDSGARVVRLTHRLNSTLYTKSGRFDQDPAAALPVLPLLARVKDLAAIPKDSNEFGFLETELIRGRNEVDSTLRDVLEAIDGYLSRRSDRR